MNVKAVIRALLLASFCAVALGCQPSPEVVGHKVQVQLQQRLDATFGGGNVKVSDVVVAHDNDKYDGAANVKAFGASTTLKMVILANQKDVIYEISPADWNAFVVAVNNQKAKTAEGKYSDVAVSNGIVFSCFPKTLQKDKARFAKRLEVVVPVKRDGDFWFGSGCTAHECGDEEAAWAIDGDKAKGYAIILYSTSRVGKSFQIYGGEPNELPPPLLSWALERGMNDFNSAVIRP